MKYVLLLCLTFAVKSWGNDNRKPIPPVATSAAGATRISDLEGAEKPPVLDLGPGLKGPDTNGNGVRDDIDLWIQNQHYPDSQKKAMVQSAKALQNTLFTNTTDFVQLQTAHKKITWATGCVYKQFPQAQQAQPNTVLKAIQKYTMNTKDRTMTYLKFNNALHGSASELPQGNPCD